MVLSTDRNLLKSFAAPSKRSLAVAALKLCAVSSRGAALGDLSYTLPKAGGLVDKIDSIVRNKLSRLIGLSKIGIASAVQSFLFIPGTSFCVDEPHGPQKIINNAKKIRIRREIRKISGCG
jgi:hypothetical protein